MKRFRARLIQEFTIIADDEEAARYAAVHRIARFADMGGIDEKLGRRKARAHDPVLDSVLEEAHGVDDNAPVVERKNPDALPKGRGGNAHEDAVGNGGRQLGFILERSDQDGERDSPADEVTGGIF